MSKRDLLLKILVPLLILIGAVAITLVMVRSRQMPEPQEKEFAGPLVDVMEVSRAERTIMVTGTGTVQPSREVAVTPQVSGQVVELSPRMVTGGFIAAGELLFAIEATDYQLALESARANQAMAELELAKIAGQAEVARLEWQRLALPGQAEPDPLVVFEPQLKSAEAQVAAARAAVAQAGLNLKRTRLVAPFNGYVRNESVEVGQYVKSGSSVATLAGTDEVEIEVPLPLEELDWINLPGRSEQTKPVNVEVRLTLGSRLLTWTGQVRRLLGDINPQNRMASLVVAVSDPFGRSNSAGKAAVQLAPGTFVEVRVQGRMLSDVVVIPRLALHDHDTVWVVDAQQTLRIRSVEVVRREKDDVLLSGGLQAGERIVLTNLSGAADGMKLRPQAVKEES